MDFEFDASLYIRPPRCDVPAAIALGSTLLQHGPPRPSAGVLQAAQRLSKTVTALQAQWVPRLGEVVTLDRRPVDTRDDAAWGALYGRVDAYAQLPVEQFPRAARATELRDTIFPDGKRFLQLEYASQWAECERRLQLIDTAGLEGDLNAVAGPEFLQNVRAMHAEYGAALGITHRTADVPEAPALAAPLRAVQVAIGLYGLQLVSMIDPDGAADDPEYVATFTAVRAALRPLDDYRAAQARNGAKPEPTPPDGAPPSGSTPA